MQKDTVSDLELNQKKRARRRLVGAVALVLLMIILLPFVLKDRNASAPQSEITISLPNENSNSENLSNEKLGSEKNKTDADFDSTVVPTDAATKQTTDLAVASQTPGTAPIVIDTAENETKAEQPTELVTKNTTVPTPEKVAPAAKEEVTDSLKKTDSEKSEQAKDTKDSASSLPDAKLAAGADKVKKGAFYIQVGVFSDEKNVKQLQVKLSDLGYRSQTEKIDTPKGKKIRLRTQVFNDRNEAAIALENIKDAGLVGMVVSQ